MLCWRLCKRRWAKTAFSGSGAAEYPGRWNSAGVRVVYCADTLALAALELLVHVEDKSYLSSAHFIAFEVQIPDELVYVPQRLPVGWKRTPPPASSRRFGDKFVTEKRAPVMRLPSVIISGGWVFALNPAHPEFAKITWKEPISFRFDRRLGSEPA